MCHGSWQNARSSSTGEKEKKKERPRLKVQCMPARSNRSLRLLYIVAFFFVMTLVVVLLSRALSAHTSRGPAVTIPQGTFVGATVTIPESQVAVEKFLGIRYALKPLGAQRFRPPVDVSMTKFTFDASEYGHMCIQVSDNMAPNENEDCLFLNVFRPVGTSSGENLPVTVHFHGGSFVFGSGASRDMAAMVAWSSEPIIGVSVNYRLGALGFLSSGLMARVGALNLGLQDQLAALKWVRQNIDSFGGDSGKVTIMGDSAGAHSVGHHLQSPASKGLFSQAVMESGAATARFCQPPTSALNEEQFKAFMDSVGIGPLKLSENDVMSALRALPISVIKKAATKVYNSYAPSNRWAFQPTIDGPGGIIPTAPLNIWTSGTWNKVPILNGFCTDEGAPFVPHSISTSQQFTAFFEILNPNWSITDLSTINDLYPDPLSNSTSPYKQTQQGPGAQHNRIMAAYGQFAYIAPVRHTAHFASTPQSNPSVYLYHFKLNHTIVGGTSHDCARGYITCDSKIINRSPAQKSLAMAMNAYWTNFIANGDPNVGKRNPEVTGAEMVVWPRYFEEATGRANKMVFGDGNDEMVGGRNVGVLTQNVTETEFVTESKFWWERTGLTEN